MAFDLKTAIPVEQSQDQKTVRSPAFDLTTAMPVKKPINETSDEKSKSGVEKTLETAGKVMTAIRWPYWRFIEQPVSTIATALQEPKGKTVGGTLGKAFQGYVPFRKIPREEYGNYGQIWRNYYKSIMNTEPPNWYVAMASYGTAMGVETPMIGLAARGAELAATRPATSAELKHIQETFAPLKARLNKGGLDTSKLYPQGNIVKISEGSELYLNKYISAVLRGDKVRVPRWANIKQVPAPIKPSAPSTGLVKTPPEVLPVTGPEITVSPPSITEPELVREAHVSPSKEEFLRIAKRINPKMSDKKIISLYEQVLERNQNPVYRAIADYKLQLAGEEEAPQLLKAFVENPELARPIKEASKQMLIESGAKYLYRYGSKEGLSWSLKPQEYFKQEGDVLQKIPITQEVLERVIYVDEVGFKLGIPEFQNIGESEVILMPKQKEIVPSSTELVTSETIQEYVLEALREQARAFPSQKEFLQAIEKGEIELPLAEFEKYGITEYTIDKPLVKLLFKEMAMEKSGLIGELKRQIYANAAVRGVSKVQLNDLVNKLTSNKAITNKTFTEEELIKVLDSLKKVRPKYIGGQRVITTRTEKKIQDAYSNMIANEEITPEIFKRMLEDMKMPAPRYVGAFQFATEKQGKELLFNMRSLANVYKNVIATEKAYSKMPAAKEYVDKIKEINPPQAVPKVNTLLDARYAYDSLEMQTGLPFGKAFEQARIHFKEAHAEIEQIKKEVFEKGGKDWNKITSNEQSLERMQQYLGSKRPAYIRGKPEYPKDITPQEKAIVDAMIAYGEGVKTEIQYERVLAWIKDGVRVPNAPMKELNKAEDIYLVQGSEALKKWLKGRSWGVITGGAYDFGKSMKGKIKVYKSKPGVSKKGTLSKETIQYTKYDTDLIRRFESYVRGVVLRKHLRDDVNSIKVFAEAVQGKTEDPGQFLDAISRNLYELLGMKTSSPQALENILRTLYSQASRTVFFDLRKGVRNLFQNAALFTSLEDAFKASPLSSADQKYFETYVSQASSIKYDYLYSDVKGLPMLKKLNDLADLVNMMGRTDTINRYIAFRMKLGAVRQALKNNPDYSKSTESLYAMLQEAGAGDITAMERSHALDKLVTKGEDEFARYIAKQVVEKVHFLYSRHERGFAEQGNELSKILSNLLVFKKGYVQRQILDISKLRPSQKEIEAPIGARKRASRSVLSAIIMAVIVGEVYKKVTGAKKNAYDPMSLTGELSLGGLATGTQEKLQEFTSTSVSALQGDRKAQAKLPGLIGGAGDLFVPLYDEMFNTLESMSDTVKLDVRFYKKIRAYFDKQYQVREIDHIKRRSILEKWQHGLFGTDTEKSRSTVPKIGG